MLLQSVKRLNSKGGRTMRKKNKGAIRETSGLAKVLIYIPLILLSILIIVRSQLSFRSAGYLLHLLSRIQSFTEVRGYFRRRFISRTLSMRGKVRIWALICSILYCDGGCDFPACDHCASGIICTGKIQV